MYFLLQKNISSEISTTLLIDFKTSDLQNLFLTTQICLYAVECRLSCYGMRRTGFVAEKSRTPHQVKPPRGVCNRYAPACFPYQNSSWTLNDTLWELYGCSTSLWGSKHRTGHCHSPCRAKEKDFAIKYKYYCGSSVLLAAVSSVVCD